MAHSRSSISWPDARARRSFAVGFGEAASALAALCIWAFVTGFAMVSYGLSEGMAVLMSVLVYAGSAQLTALPLMMAGAPLWLIFAAGFVVNIRFIIFGAALQPYFRKYSWPKRLALGYWCSDLVFVFFMTRYGDARRKGTRGQLWYYLGIIVPGWFLWQFFSLLGIYMGAFVPPEWSLEFAATLALMGVAIPLVKAMPMAVSVLVTGAVAWLGQPLPLRLGLAVAIVAGVVAGVLAEKHKAGWAA
ncbi:AzlC family ABC transporter permease [Pusillimonas sp.]|uniref:AzlC family ABC transporter permease n=1 Tax=Pusillimonas sp. TaxID=3040095 RepID=UPI0039B934AF